MLGVLHGAARHHEHLRGAEIGHFKQNVGLHRDLMAACHLPLARERDGLHVQLRTAQHINRGQGLDFFKSIGHQLIYFCHSFFIY